MTYATDKNGNPLYSETEEVYLLHFDEPYKHAGHYIGLSDNVLRRKREHDNGYGAALTKAAVASGIPLKLARVWTGNKYLENLLQSWHGGAQLCPICNPNACNVANYVPNYCYEEVTTK